MVRKPPTSDSDINDDIHAVTSSLNPTATSFKPHVVTELGRSDNVLQESRDTSQHDYIRTAVVLDVIEDKSLAYDNGTLNDDDDGDDIDEDAIISEL